jgi:threonine aldolase
MRHIDLRSDTVTQPTEAMRKAMYQAELGDDVYGEDPTVNRLEALAAERMGKEAALFVVSGTMGNLVALLTHCGRGDEIIMGDKAHTFLYEAGGVSALGGIHVHTVPNQPNGMLDLADVEQAIRTDNIHFPRTRVITIENTHNRCGGAVLSVEQMASIKALAQRHGLMVHLDGARIFNAAVALGVPVGDLAAQVDTVQFCISKGLSAPVGSLIAGPAAFIAEARRTRKIVGGGMRQAGVLAAAGIVALEQMVERLAEDHANARRLAEGLADIPGIAIEPEAVQSNIVFFGVSEGRMALAELGAALAQEGVLFSQTEPTRFRAVTHYGITAEDIEATLATVARALARA